MVFILAFKLKIIMVKAGENLALLEFRENRGKILNFDYRLQ
tara:strand:+ start:1127 stop:1249 length:123 start_codon:yes stop_codon:yes gene_type:complete